ncbi:MAG: type I glutamate--ammonia ligase [Alphaproteobacteria bacterium]|jgi:glutamine synthetase|nr:type I glutamate--ammonia ligase [Alphaproteobacteria bacterium]MCB1551465.1 type I glutamate--ammonia ligase [Alphaproteobacteria bacterium]MCB9984621.1 type I glutamate--ammonia ligase [Micavibrio sp.]HPQ51522.1 type I glutamate--ammonia ligase [Alphaproteobacteria bacterium]HRK97964.1 type I glutamate--ammonia ligase [Alphaproteobacteria bacterium]
MTSASALKFKNASDFVKYLKEEGKQYVDFLFADMRGKQQHTTQHVSTIDENLLTEGIYFDGSSISGWKAINESDMILLPDLSRVCVDPFSAQPTIKIFCFVLDPNTRKPYERCPRSVAKAAQDYLKGSGIGDTAFFGPEAEFFVFDDVKYKVSMNKVSYEIDSEESPCNTDSHYDEGNLGHRPRVKGGYFPDSPIDTGTNLRAEMLSVIASMGVEVEKHHHEVAPSQHELGIKFDTLLNCGDNMQIYKHVVHNVAAAYGQSATFMPKPIFGDNGSGMHVHQSLWKGSTPLFAGDGYAGLSETALFYIGGIIKHAKALNAFTNPTTNSYKRLVPGFEAPVLLAYSSRNRSASCRIPHSGSPKGKRVEVRFPDPTANPYLAYSAMLMAGLDGIKNKIHPGEAHDKDLYHLPPEELAKVPTVCGSLRQALDSLKADHEFLTAGDVFSKDLIEAYIDLKMEEVLAYETMPHPIEYDMYYSS